MIMMTTIYGHKNIVARRAYAGRCGKLAARGAAWQRDPLIGVCMGER